MSSPTKFELNLISSLCANVRKLSGYNVEHKDNLIRLVQSPNGFTNKIGEQFHPQFVCKCGESS